MTSLCLDAAHRNCYNKYIRFYSTKDFNRICLFPDSPHLEEGYGENPVELLKGIVESPPKERQGGWLGASSKRPEVSAAYKKGLTCHLHSLLQDSHG